MYYLRPGDPGIKRQNEFCQLWAAKPGVKVTVITSQLHYNTGQVYADLRGQRMVREMDGPVEVLRVAAWDIYHRGFKGRALSQMSWTRNVTRQLRSIGQPDIVIGVTPPLFITPALIAAKRQLHCPALLEVCDIWPDYIIKMRIASKYHPGIMALSSLERWAYANSDHLVVTAETQRAHIARRGLKHPDDISVILHGAMRSAYDAVAATQRQDMRNELGISEDKVVAVYAGSHGPIYKISGMLEVAKLLRHRSDILILSIGAGTDLAWAMQEASRLSLSNIRFLGPRQVDAIPGYLAAADIGLSFVYPDAQPGWDEETHGVFRSALFDYFAAKLPVVFNDPGDPKRRIQDEVHGGLYADTTLSYGQMAEHIAKLAVNPELRREMGENNYREFAVPYDRAVLAEEYLELMAQVIARAKH